MPADDIDPARPGRVRGFVGVSQETTSYWENCQRCGAPRNIHASRTTLGCRGPATENKGTEWGQVGSGVAERDEFTVKLCRLCSASLWDWWRDSMGIDLDAELEAAAPSPDDAMMRRISARLFGEVRHEHHGDGWRSVYVLPIVGGPYNTRAEAEANAKDRGAG